MRKGTQENLHRSNYYNHVDNTAFSLVRNLLALTVHRFPTRLQEAITSNSLTPGLPLLLQGQSTLTCSLSLCP